MHLNVSLAQGVMLGPAGVPQGAVLYPVSYVVCALQGAVLCPVFVVGALRCIIPCRCTSMCHVL